MEVEFVAGGFVLWSTADDLVVFGPWLVASGFVVLFLPSCKWF